MKRIFRYFLLILLVSLTLFVIVYRHELVYGIGQLRGQLNIIAGTVPIEQLLNDPLQPDSVKHQISYIQEVKRFTEEVLGYKPSKNYTTYFEQHGQPILWTVSAALPYELKAYYWKFPLIGSFSYKGFFDLAKAEQEEAKLNAMGYDTRINEVSAWSTLGYFKDPILSSMLRRGPGSLAELIIHELTHYHLYIKDSVSFNENLANFVGRKGAELFMQQKFGQESEELARYQAHRADSRIFRNYMRSASQRLDSLYQSMVAEDDAVKQIQKETMIRSILEGVGSLPFQTDLYQSNNFNDWLPNNTYFLSFLRYNDYEEELEQQLSRQFEGKLEELLRHYKANYNSL
jgi:predicted aminopeptidase